MATTTNRPAASKPEPVPAGKIEVPLGEGRTMQFDDLSEELEAFIHRGGHLVSDWGALAAATQIFRTGKSLARIEIWTYAPGSMTHAVLTGFEPKGPGFPPNIMLLGGGIMPERRARR